MSRFGRDLIDSAKEAAAIAKGTLAPARIHSRMKNPPNPGSFVRAEIIEPAELSVTAAAAVLGVTRPALSSLLNERSALSPEMALRIEKAFGVSMDTLMRMQSSYDIAEARKREGEIKVAPYRPAA